LEEGLGGEPEIVSLLSGYFAAVQLQAKFTDCQEAIYGCPGPPDIVEGGGVAM